MRTFVTKHQKSGLKITFQYDLEGVLRIVEMVGAWKPDQVQSILSKIPTELDRILADIKNQKPESKWTFAEVTEISFAEFYRRYPKKVGRKEQTEKMWNKLKEADQLEAILYIEELKKLKNDGTAFPYPATYLNQKHWK